MSSGYNANRGWVISYEKVRELFPAEMEQFENAAEAYDDKETYYTAVQALAYGDLDDNEPLKVAFMALRAAVHVMTGLEIETLDYDEEAGDIYDDIPYPCFWADGVETFTPWGSKAVADGLVHDAMWVQFG